jgi:hypothetical protein
MARLTVALEEGFDDEAVAVEVDGRTAFADEHVRSRPEIGLATSFEVDVAAEEATVLLHCRGRTEAVTVRTAEPAWLGFSLDPDTGAVQHRVSSTPYGYL